jgi:VCBS repeat-containing protein
VKKKKLALLAGLSGALTLALVLPLLAASVEPDPVRGAASKTCQQLADQHAPGSTWYELKVDPPKAGQSSNGTLTVNIANLTSRTFDWSVVGGPRVDAVYVKAGSQGGNLYHYEPSSLGDTGLSSPGTQSISHISFCYSGNSAPVAVNDAYSTAEDTVLLVAAPGVLGNDSDVDGDALTAVLVAGPSNGVLTLNADGSFSYTPAANFNGSDSFTYKANDGAADSNVATVSITVTAVNDAPVAVNDAYSTAEDTVLLVAAPGVLGNDSDVDGDALTAVLVAGPSNGVLTLNADGSFSYTPAANFNGSDSFTYKANDGAADSNVATVSITVTAVNDAPVAVNDAYSTAEDTVLLVAAPGVLGNDSDVDGDALTAVLVAGPSNGVLTLNADGSFSYTPAANFNGSDSFTYKANDGAADSNVATVSITVFPTLACGDEVIIEGDGVEATYLLLDEEDPAKRVN